MKFHRVARQCLENLTQQETDGGRWEYLEQEERLSGREPEMPTGDCAVVALVYAAFKSPSGQAYREARQNLWMSICPRMLRERMMGETQVEFLYRRFKQWFRTPNRDPIHGTSSYATGSWLQILGYSHIFPNKNNNWYCICDRRSTYVFDVLIPGYHTFTAHGGVAYTTAPFDPATSIVGNVHWLNPERTRELKAVKTYKEAEDNWFRNWMDSGMATLPDWNSRPRLEDFLQKKSDSADRPRGNGPAGRSSKL